MVATVDYTYSALDFEKNSNGFGLWFNNGGNVTSATINQNGTYTNVAERGGDYATNISRSESKAENKSLGFNLEWEVSNSVILDIDYHTSSATSRGAGLGHDAFLIIGNTSCSTCEQLTAEKGQYHGQNTANIDIKKADFTGLLPIWWFNY